VTKTWLVILLALLASYLFALAAFLQHRAARSSERTPGSVFKRLHDLMARLVRDRTWQVGWWVNLTGFFTQATALQLGSVAAVQPFMPMQLLFAMPMSSLERHSWPRRRDWLSALSICMGVVTLMLVDGAAPLSGSPDRPRVLLAVVAAVAMVVLLVGIASRVARRAASVIAAAAAGLCFAASAVLMKVTADDLVVHGVGYTARDWTGYALAGSTLLGLVIEQASFSSGPLPWSVAVMNTVNPVASYAAGILAFDVAFPTDPHSLAGIALAGALLVAGATGLAHSPSAGLWFPETARAGTRQRPRETAPAGPRLRGRGTFAAAECESGPHDR
jgi:hypothetical protein